MTSSNQRLTDRKREAIIQAAIAEFRANGFDATSVDKVAARAEVSKRTLYNHFPSKDELFAGILQVLWDSSTVQEDVLYQADAPIRAQLIKLLIHKMKMFADDNFLHLARVAMVAFIHSPQRARDMMDRLNQKESNLLGWIRSAKKDGRLKINDPGLAVQQLESLVKGAAFWPQVIMGQPKLSAVEQRKVASAAVDLFLGQYDKP